MSEKDNLINLIADTLRKQLSIDAPPQRVISSSSFRRSRSRQKVTGYPLKILFSRKETRDGKDYMVFYVGGDRAKPTKITEIDWLGVDYFQSVHYTAYLENTGRRQDDWIFNLCYRQTPKGINKGRTTVVCISPRLPEHNWKLENAPAGLGYIGGGTWRGVAWFVPIALNIVTISENPKVEQVTGYITAAEEANWNDLGYDTPLDFASGTVNTNTVASSRRFCEHNIAFALVERGRIQITRGRQWYLVRDTPFWTTTQLEFQMPFHVSPTVIKEEFSISFFPLLVSPNAERIIYYKQKSSYPFPLGQQWQLTTDSDIALTGDVLGLGVWRNDAVYAIANFDYYLTNSGVFKKKPDAVKETIDTGINIYRIDGMVVKKDEKPRKVRNVYPIPNLEDTTLIIHSYSYFK